MLADIQPNLKNIADWHAVFPDNSTKSTLVVPRNAQVEVCFFFLCISERPSSFRTAAFKRSR